MMMFDSTDTLYRDSDVSQYWHPVAKLCTANRSEHVATNDTASFLSEPGSGWPERTCTPRNASVSAAAVSSSQPQQQQRQPLRNLGLWPYACAPSHIPGLVRAGEDDSIGCNPLSPIVEYSSVLEELLSGKGVGLGGSSAVYWALPSARAL